MALYQMVKSWELDILSAGSKVNQRFTADLGEIRGGGQIRKTESEVNPVPK